MVKVDKYKKNFKPHDVPPTLAKLVAFDEKVGDFFSDGFEIAVDDKGGIKTWSEDPKFLGALFPIGQATGTGSTYAFWTESGTDLEAAPIVVFGDEGGVHVIAEDLEALLRILTFDSEPMIDHDEISFYKGDDHEPSVGADDYVAWLAKELKLKPVKNDKEVEELVKAAQNKYAKPFAKWMAQYFDA